MAGKGRQRGGSARAKGAGVQIGKKQTKSNGSTRKSQSFGSGNRVVKDTGLAIKRRKLTNPLYAQNLPREGSEDSYEDSDEDEDDEDDEDDDDRHIRTPSSYNKGGRNRNGGKAHHGSSGSEGNDDAPVWNKRKKPPSNPSESDPEDGEDQGRFSEDGHEEGQDDDEDGDNGENGNDESDSKSDGPTDYEEKYKMAQKTYQLLLQEHHALQHEVDHLKNQLTLHRSTIANFRSATSESSVETSRNMFMTSITNHQVSLLVAEIFRTKKFASDNVSSFPPPCSTSCSYTYFLLQSHRHLAELAHPSSVGISDPTLDWFAIKCIERLKSARPDIADASVADEGLINYIWNGPESTFAGESIVGRTNPARTKYLGSTFGGRCCQYIRHWQNVFTQYIKDVLSELLGYESS